MEVARDGGSEGMYLVVVVIILMEVTIVIVVTDVW